MSYLVWEMCKKYGWANLRDSSNGLVFDVCYIRQVENGLWIGEYMSPHRIDRIKFPGEYPLEELKAVLETTITLLEAK